MSDQTNISIGGAGVLNLFTHGGSADNRADAWTPHRIPEDDLTWLYDRFVQPPGYREARRVLMVHRTVLLRGESGSGRQTTARMLLHDLARPSGTLHALSPETDDGGPTIPPDRIDAGDQMWLDLTTADDVLWRRINGELPALRATVEDRRAYLVVILPERARVPSDVDRILVEIERPDATEVLLRHLRTAQIDLGEKAQLDADLAAAPGRVPPLRWVAELAALVCRARDRDSTGGAAQWYARAKAAVADQSLRVAEILREVDGGVDSGLERALLLTVAMVHEGSLRDVHAAAEMLLQVTEHPPTETPLLLRNDLAACLDTIDAGEDASGQVHFTRLGLDVAVRLHYWNHRPDLRPYLIRWIDRVVESSVLTQDGLMQLVTRFSEQCLQNRHPDDLSTLQEKVRRWTAGSMSPYGQSACAASRALDCALRNEAAAGQFRRKILDWSTEPKLSAALTHVLVEMCVEVISERYPDQALVRLHHLTRRHRDLTEPRSALLRLVEQVPGLRRQMFDRLAQTFGSVMGSDRARWAVDTGLFLDLSAPEVLLYPHDRLAEPLLDEPAVREHLALCWGGVLTTEPAVWAGRLRSWLLALTKDEQHRETVLDLLVAGCHRQVDALSALYEVAGTWAEDASAAEASARDQIRTLLLRKIRTARRPISK
ncbi:nSTAND3 domain-containing NTPase [Parafrankia elaeagni]|uniref:nSTAND3 domain-containing NTPase n=1 Tax=Parafrankia elaeagni TaxID=222534 RepID=UPI0003A73C47|nr:hypothetical protein [Parafrankia elaeagni]